MSACEGGHEERLSAPLPLVEIFQTVEGEGTTAGYPTVFVRLFGCPLRCTWCDTPYSYAPAQPQMTLTIPEICARVTALGAQRICLTGGEPLLFGARSGALLEALAELHHVRDIHVETGGSIDLAPFVKNVRSDKVRYIVDYKLPGSGQQSFMCEANLTHMRTVDEIKFVIADETDFQTARDVLLRAEVRATVLFSPVFGKMQPSELVALMLAHQMWDVKLSLQTHKYIWDPAMRGV